MGVGGSVEWNRVIGSRCGVSDDSQEIGWIRSVLLVLTVWAYYFIPVAACIGIAWLVPGWWKAIPVAGAIAWPVGNVVIGLVHGCD